MSATATNISEQLLQMISGIWVNRAIYVAAKLGIADLLKDGAKSVEELAAETEVDTRSLYRVLRALASVGIFSEVERSFELTPMAEYLRSDVPQSLRAMAIMFGGEEWHYQPWANVLYSVKTGKPAFDKVFGMPAFPYLNQNPEAAAIFDGAMTSFSAAHSAAIANSYDFASIKTLVDVGGGHGSLLTGILKTHPTLNGIVYDLPPVIAGAKLHLENDSISDRCTTIAGDFFESVPSGGDAYMMKHIIHDWDDDRAIAILKNCYNAMPDNGKLLVIEHVIPDDNTPSPSQFLDLEMLVMTSGGRERTASEFQQLFAAAGFHLTQIVATKSPLCVIEGRKS